MRALRVARRAALGLAVVAVGVGSTVWLLLRAVAHFGPLTIAVFLVAAVSVTSAFAYANDVEP